MKNFKKVMAMGLATMAALSAMSMSAMAAETNNISAETSVAYMNYDAAPESMKEAILDARVDAVFAGNQSWTIDGQVGYVDEDGNYVAFPEFSDVFPGWDYDAINARYQELTPDASYIASEYDNQIAPMSISRTYFNNNVSFKKPSDSQSSTPFTTFNSNSDKYLKCYAQTMPGTSVNFGVTKNGTEVGYANFLAVGQPICVTNDSGQTYAFRGSTYSTTGNGRVVVYACSNAND